MPAMTVRDLLDRLTDPQVAVFDCRFLLDAPGACRHEYLHAHIPGAAYVHLDHDLSATPTGRNGRHPLPEPAAIESLFGRLGISNDVDVVGYDSAGGGLAASRLWWMLRYLGHDRVSILDGGWPAWLKAGGPTRSAAEVRGPAAFRGRLRRDLALDADAVAEAAASRDWIVLDVRGPTRYRGEEEPIDPVAGHIPGARNRYWMESLTPDGHLRPPADLRAEFDRLLGGVVPDHVICYCGSGVTSAHTILAMERSGLPGARLYSGSWSEWCSDPARPVARGTEPA